MKSPTSRWMVVFYSELSHGFRTVHGLIKLYPDSRSFHSHQDFEGFSIRLHKLNSYIKLE